MLLVAGGCKSLQIVCATNLSDPEWTVQFSPGLQGKGPDLASSLQERIPDESELAAAKI